jgi:uncharacterized membrane protein YfcA
MDLMEILPYCIISIAAFIAALSTFFSGFGLGTILLPVFSLFFSPEIALATTAVVHFINGSFKVMLTVKNVNWPIFMRFGFFALIGSAVGSYLIYELLDFGNLYSITIAGISRQIDYMHFFLGVVMLLFAFLEFSNYFEKRNVAKSWIPVGGLLSGFFGGFSGHQGAIRSAFLSNSLTSKFEFVATSALLAVIIDITRISTYSQRVNIEIPIELVFTGATFAILGSLLGNRILIKTEMTSIKWIVGFFLCIIGTSMLLGLI